MAIIDNEWEEFLKQDREFSVMTPPVRVVCDNEDDVHDEDARENGVNTKLIRTECEELYISTQTKIFFLSASNLDVDNIFWNTTVIPYTTRSNGVIKKQIRFIFKQKEEFQMYIDKRDKELYFTEKILKQIDNPNARKIKFKDVRKLTVGISKKDIMNCHGKNKNVVLDR